MVEIIGGLALAYAVVRGFSFVRELVYGGL